jgi:hypothetical protein
MKKSDVKKVIEVAENLGWSVTEENGEFSFQQFSPAGQDFTIEFTVESLEDLSKELTETYEAFDCSSETYLWLDKDGHGTNGAPYDMKDLYEDMQACEEMLRELSMAIQNLI